MTYKELINEVLIRLREDIIVDDSWDVAINLQDESRVSDYQKMIGALVNDAKRNVESYHDWIALKTDVALFSKAGTYSYTLVNTKAIKVLSVTNTVTGSHLTQSTLAYATSLRFPTKTTGEPLHYVFSGSDAVGDLKLELIPEPINDELLHIEAVKVHPKLELPNDIIRIPEQPVLLGAWMRAIAERGEDGGSQTSVVAQEFKEAINQAIIRDSGNTQYETDWYTN
jgi:hypothetical protein